MNGVLVFLLRFLSCPSPLGSQWEPRFIEFNLHLAFCEPVDIYDFSYAHNNAIPIYCYNPVFDVETDP